MINSAPNAGESRGWQHFASFCHLSGLSLWLFTLCHIWVQDTNLIIVNTIFAPGLVLAMVRSRNQTSAVFVVGDNPSEVWTSIDFYERALVKIAITIVNWGMASAIKNP